MNQQPANRYPLLSELLELLGLPFKALYSTRDLAPIFGVSIRSIQSRIATGQLKPRNLPGRAKFLAQDIEQFLQESRRNDRR